MDKEKAIWWIKLIGLSIAIYWFITDGFTQNVSESFGIGSSEKSTPTWLIILFLAYLAFVSIRTVYNKSINKPKDENYKKYREMK